MQRPRFLAGISNQKCNLHDLLLPFYLAITSALFLDGDTISRLGLQGSDQQRAEGKLHSAGQDWPGAQGRDLSHQGPRWEPGSTLPWIPSIG